jgi:hypothetical protein
MEDNARNNIRLYRSCLTVDFVTTVLLEAIADATGGDLPMAMLMGEISPQGENTSEPRHWMKLGDFLPKVVGINGDIDPLTMFLLRRSESALATFVYNGLGEKGLKNLEEKSYEFLAGRLLDKDFLAAFPDWVLVPIARACARICPSRAEELSQIAQDAIESGETQAEFETLRAVV